MWNAYSSQLISNEINPYDYASEKEQGQQVREAVERLPEMLRQVLYLVYFQGMKCREASKALGIPISIVRKRLNAAVKKLYFMLVKAVA